MCTKHGITVYKLNKYTVLLFAILPIDLHGNTVYNTIKIKKGTHSKPLQAVPKNQFYSFRFKNCTLII